MRVRRFGLVRLRDEERGATLAIVAISLIALLGMLVLTFDLGRGVALKRNMVNAADAAALAAARECGLARGEPSAMQAAGELVVQNNGAAEVIGFELAPGANCGAGSLADPNGKNEVTVTTSVAQEYFFAQIFGFEEGAVVASATAEWTLGVSNPAPLRVDALRADECTSGGSGYSGPECFFEFEKDAQSQWGWLDFPEGWPAPGGPNPLNCSSQKGGTSDLQDYIRQMGAQLGGPGSFAPSMWTNPVWVCAEGGFVSEATSEIVAWLNAVAAMDPRPIVYFPVVAPNCPAAGCISWITGSGAAYPVIRFQGFRIEGAWRGQDARRQENCVFERRSADVFCIQVSALGPDEVDEGNRPIVRLVD